MCSSAAPCCQAQSRWTRGPRTWTSHSPRAQGLWDCPWWHLGSATQSLLYPLSGPMSSENGPFRERPRSENGVVLTSDLRCGSQSFGSQIGAPHWISDRISGRISDRISDRTPVKTVRSQNGPISDRTMLITARSSERPDLSFPRMVLALALVHAPHEDFDPSSLRQPTLCPSLLHSPLAQEAIPRGGIFPQLTTAVSCGGGPLSSCQLVTPFIPGTGDTCPTWKALQDCSQLGQEAADGTARRGKSIR